MTNQVIEQLLAKSSTPCISVIVPMHRTAPDKIKDLEAVTSAVDLAKNILTTNYSETSYDTNTLINKIDELVKTIDFIHPQDGVGIFVSPNIFKLVNFPFPVGEKVKVGHAFERMDLLYYLNTIIDYGILAISQKKINLFLAKGEELFEINNQDFPLIYEETYEYSKPSIGTSYSNSSLKGFEKDKTEIEEIRLKDLLRKADHLLEKYINTKTPLVIAGGKKEISDYTQVTKFEKRIIGKVTGNYNNANVQLAKLSWAAVQDYQKNQNQIISSNLHELFGRELVAVGMEDVWKQANEGRGLELYIPKDFDCSAYISNDGYDLKLLPPSATNKYIYSVDVVERLINTVRDKRGKVVFLESDQLADFDNIALQLRYNNQP